MLPYAVIVALCFVSTAWSDNPVPTLRRSLTLGSCVLFGSLSGRTRSGCAARSRWPGDAPCSSACCRSPCSQRPSHRAGDRARLRERDARRVLAEEPDGGMHAARGRLLLLPAAGRGVAARPPRLCWRCCCCASCSADPRRPSASRRWCCSRRRSWRRGTGPALRLAAVPRRRVGRLWRSASCVVAPEVLLAAVRAGRVADRPRSAVARGDPRDRAAPGAWATAMPGSGTRTRGTCSTSGCKAGWRAPDSHDGYLDVLGRARRGGPAAYLGHVGPRRRWRRRSQRAGTLRESRWLVLFMLINVVLNLDEGPMPYSQRFHAC